MSASSFAGGVLAGFGASVLFAVVGVALQQWRFGRALGGRSGTYSVRRKLSSEPEPERLLITVKGNRLSVQSQGGENPYTGAITMNEQLIESGRGHYRQTVDGDELWGLWDVQLKDVRTILVHTTYAHYKEHRAVVSGFVWEQIHD